MTYLLLQSRKKKLSIYYRYNRFCATEVIRKSTRSIVDSKQEKKDTIVYKYCKHSLHNIIRRVLCIIYYLFKHKWRRIHYRN
jgi:hypothetical protein